MKRIVEQWTAQGLPAYPEDQVDRIGKQVRGEYLPLCASFWLYRYLHRTVNADCTLLGDYCFGIFSAYLAELDSVPLNDAFSAYLQEDTKEAKSFEEYLGFVTEVCGGKE